VKLLIVSEGKHELGGALETIVRRLVRIVADFEFRKVSDRVIGALHGRGPRYAKRAIQWLRYAAKHSYDGLVLLIDQDDQVNRRRQISDAQDELRLTSLPRAMGVAVRTFDAWMLADEQALTAVLSLPVQRQQDPERIVDPKSVCTALRDAAPSNLNLALLYAELAKVIDLSVLAWRCPLGFEPFAGRVHRMAEQLAN
jgi:hypothetical protein